MKIGFHSIGLGSWSDHGLRHHSQAGRESVHVSLTQCWDRAIGWQEAPRAASPNNLAVVPQCGKNPSSASALAPLSQQSTQCFVLFFSPLTSSAEQLWKFPMRNRGRTCVLARRCCAKTAFWKNAENSFNCIPPLPHPQITQWVSFQITSRAVHAILFWSKHNVYQVASFGFDLCQVVQNQVDDRRPVWKWS